MAAAPTKDGPGADVQLEDGFFKLANQIATAVAMAPWESAAQPRLVMALLRATYGLRGRKDADLGTSTWVQLTGLTDKIVRRHRQRLQKEGVLILVRDFDARTSTPQRWRIRKDFTKWGAFAVDLDAIQAAEKAATDLLKETQKEVTPPPMGDPSPHGGGEGTPEGGEEGPQRGGGPPPTGGGRVRPNGVGAVGESDAERQGKDRKDRESTPPIGPPQPAKADRKPRRWRFVPDGWEPGDRHRDLAAELGVDLDQEAGKFRDHEFKTSRSDPDRAFSAWLRRAVEFGGGGRAPPGMSRADARLMQRRKDLDGIDLNASGSVFDD